MNLNYERAVPTPTPSSIQIQFTLIHSHSHQFIHFFILHAPFTTTIVLTSSSLSLSLSFSILYNGSVLTQPTHSQCAPFSSPPSSLFSSPSSPHKQSPFSPQTSRPVRQDVVCLTKPKAPVHHHWHRSPVTKSTNHASVNPPSSPHYTQAPPCKESARHVQQPTC